MAGIDCRRAAAVENAVDFFDICFVGEYGFLQASLSYNFFKKN